MFEIVVSAHLHTQYSDGMKLHNDIAEEAARAGLDVIIATDHNVRAFGVEGYHEGVLVLTGEEVHNRRKESDDNHCLIYNCDEEMSPFAAQPQRLMDEVSQRGGLTFFAHPLRREPRGRNDRQALCWTHWNLQNYTGFELWNYQTEVKSWQRNLPMIAFGYLFPALLIRGPFRATLRKWDELTMGGKRVVGISGTDAHGRHPGIGSRIGKVFSYEHAFRCLNTHLLIDDQLSRDLARDKALVYGALGAGHAFVAYDLSHSARGFMFSGSSGVDQVVMGDALRRRGAVHLKVECPAPGMIHLLRNGKIIARKRGRALKHITTDAGVYRVEVYRPFRLLNRGWIYSNPIYVT